MSNNLSSCISVALGLFSQKKSEFYMSSFLIDCILCTQSFLALKCKWDKAKSPVYPAYQLLWAHKYFNHYKSICEDFIIPLYRLIFLIECDCMSEEALNFVQDNGHYYLTEEGLYLRMFGISRDPSLFPKYATDYVIHKEVVRQLYIDGVVNFLFEQKKVVYPPVLFYIGSYKFSKVKSASKFVKELEYFHFWEKSFHINDSVNKITDYCAVVGVHFEYTKY